MLVLSRAEGQSFVVDERVVVSILEYKEGKVRVGVAAPVDVRIDREEVYRRRMVEQRRLRDIPETFVELELKRVFSRKQGGRNGR